jgi:hypothetical protein
MLQVSGDLDLLEEAIRPDDRGDLGPNDFDGYLALVLSVTRQVDRRHAPLAELALDFVAIGECRAEPVDGIHRMNLDRNPGYIKTKLPEGARRRPGLLIPQRLDRIDL